MHKRESVCGGWGCGVCGGGGYGGADPHLPVAPTSTGRAQGVPSVPTECSARRSPAQLLPAESSGNLARPLIAAPLNLHR